MKFERLISAGTFKTYWKDIKAVLDDCSEKGKRVHVLVEAEVKKRSTGPGSQSHHLNGHIQQIAMYTGQPFQDIKKYVKQQAISMGFPILERLGNPVIDLWGNPVGISEADCTTAQCALLIEQTHMLASELGIILVENEHDWNY